MLSSILTLHIIAGAIALLAGYVVICLEKGKKVHKVVGRSYVIAMLLLGLSGTYIAIIRDIPLSMLNGLVLCYFVLSSLNIVWQKPKSTNNVDKMLFVFVAAITTAFAWYIYQTTQTLNGKLGGFGAPAYVVFGSVMAMCTFADFRYIKRKGLSGSSRLARHLWRMFFPLLMSTAAFFLGQAKHLPESIQRIDILLMPVVLVTLSSIYWLVRIKNKN